YTLGQMAVEDATQVAVFVLVAALISALSREKSARVKAQAVSKAREDILQEVAHELRTPAAAILGWADVLQRATDPANKAHACKVIEKNARLQVMLVGDLLDLARITSGKTRPGPGAG